MTTQDIIYTLHTTIDCFALFFLFFGAVIVISAIVLLLISAFSMFVDLYKEQQKQKEIQANSQESDCIEDKSDIDINEDTIGEERKNCKSRGQI